MEPHRSPNDLRLLSPEFTPRPGWGGQLASWCREHAGTWVVRLAIVIMVPVVMAYLGNRLAQVLWPLPSVGQQAPEVLDITVPVKAGEGITHAARLALYEYLATRPLPPLLAPEQMLFAEDWLRRQMPDAAPAPGQEITFSYDLLARSILLAQSLSPEQRTAWSRYLP